MRWLNDFPQDENDVPVAFLFQMISVLLLRFAYGLTLLRINSETLREFSFKLRTRSDNTVYTVTVLYQEQSVVRYPTLDPLPHLPDHNSPQDSSSQGSSPCSLSSYHQAPASLPPSPPLGTFCPCCKCNLERGKFCRHSDQTFYRPEGERIIALQDISIGTRHSPQHSIPHSTSLPSLRESISPPGLIQDPNIIRNLPQDCDPEVNDCPPLPPYSTSTLPAYI